MRALSARVSWTIWTLATLAGCASILGVDGDYDALATDGGADAPTDVEPSNDASNVGDVHHDGDAPPLDPTCAPSPRENPAAVRDGCGIFVAPGPVGSDTHPGTRRLPVASIAHALIEAKARFLPRIYLCSSTWSETISLQDNTVSEIFGGLSCPTSMSTDGVDAGDADSDAGLSDDAWQVTATPTRLTPDTSGPVLRITGLTAPVRVEDVAMFAKPATDPGQSSIGAWISQSSDVRFAHVVIRAAPARDGDDGRVAMAATEVPDGGGNAPPTNSTLGAPGPVCSCAPLPGISYGGAGGKGGGLGTEQPGEAGAATPPVPVTILTEDGDGGATPCGIGHRGASAGPAADGPGASDLGHLTASGWEGRAGTDGADGLPGQGGGGTGGSNSIGNGTGGGSGGCGGCGGGGGGGGKPGGMSSAILVFQSTLSLVDAVLGADSGGRGGAGRPGEKGASGAPGVSCNPFPFFGAYGGNGGSGGNGGGGAGGFSSCVAYTGQRPTLDSASETRCIIGTPGAGGNASLPTLRGVDGMAVSVLPLTP